MTIAPIACSRIPKWRLRPPYEPVSTLPPSAISVKVDGARSADPPTNSGTFAATHWITVSDDLRVAVIDPEAWNFGTSRSQPSGSLPAISRSNSGASSGWAWP